MDTITDPTPLQPWLDAYRAAGFKLIPIPAGQKSPRHHGWQLEENCVVPDTWTGNIGLALAYCDPPLMTADIDWYSAAYHHLMELGVDLAGHLNAPDAVRISSGKAEHYKLVYRLPAWCGPLARKQVTQDGKAIIDFRCASRSGHTVQDVLPPSIHPNTGKPYVWEGDFRNIPEIPADLFNVWLGLLQRAPKPSKPDGVRDHTEEELRSALDALDPDMPRDEWVRMGMALHAADSTLDWLFDEWSAGGDKYVGSDIDAVWNSFDETSGGVSAGTLFRAALDAGWRSPGPSVQEMLNLPPAAEPEPKSLGSAAVAASAPTGGVLMPPPVPGTKDLASLMRDIDALHPWSMTEVSKVEALNGFILEGMALDPGSQEGVRDAVIHLTAWNKTTFDATYRDLKKLRTRALKESRGGGDSLQDVFGKYVYVSSFDKFLHRESAVVCGRDAFKCRFLHLDTELDSEVFKRAGVQTVDAVEFDPGAPTVFERKGTLYYNSWRGLACAGKPGDVAPWLEHLTRLVPEAIEREHMLDWMAFTLQRPEQKINHAFVWGGAQGIGKDMLLRPLVKAFGRHAKEVEGHELEREFNSYLDETKFMLFGEVEYSGHKEAKKIANKIKALAAAPPATLRVNRKGLGEYDIRNVVCTALTTNSRTPIEVVPGDRRYFMVYSELTVVGPGGAKLPEWDVFFRSYWAWQNADGADYVINYLLSRDVSAFNPGARPPMTEGKQEAIASSRSPLDALLNDMIEGQLGPFAADVVTSDIVRRYLSGNEGLNLIGRYGLREVPSAIILGRGLRAQALTQGKQIRAHGHKIRIMWCGNSEAVFQEGVVEYLDTHPATCNLVPWR